MKTIQKLAVKIRLKNRELSETIEPDPIDLVLRELLKPQGQLTHKEPAA